MLPTQKQIRPIISLRKSPFMERMFEPIRPFFFLQNLYNLVERKATRKFLLWCSLMKAQR